MSTTDDSDGTILTRSGLDLRRLAKIALPPRPFAGSQRSFWNDPFVSQHLLNAHLDPNTNDASRRPDERAAAVARIIDFATDHGKGPPASMLDLGCGPGLYAMEFAHAGYSVTGVDFSPVSIEHARASAHKAGVPARFELADLRTADVGNGYSLASIIYGEFCTFSQSERTKLLGRVHSALSTGGVFVLDAFTAAYAHRHRVANDWYVGGRNGFWADRDHLVLELVHHYPDAQTSLARYAVVLSDGKYRLFDVWWRHFTREELVAVLEAAGFTVVELLGSLSGEPWQADGEWLAAFCVKR